MSTSTLLLVLVGALVGAPLRFVVERLLAAAWPWGTWLVNVVGSAVLGVLVGVVGVDGPGSHAGLVALVGTGFCGSLTTFGGFAAQVLDLAAAPTGSRRSSRSWRALGYAAASLVACAAVAAAGYATVVSLGGV